MKPMPNAHNTYVTTRKYWSLTYAWLVIGQQRSPARTPNARSAAKAMRSEFFNLALTQRGDELD
ncbi:Uncharacterised protein [Mycobacteroides abscessus subsp. abscessus]|nr:Uncharacterised protein [Mycobacteroides abscessus subsp. abscessus]